MGGKIYFIKVKDLQKDVILKIGMTSNRDSYKNYSYSYEAGPVMDRLKALQTSNPHELIIDRYFSVKSKSISLKAIESAVHERACWLRYVKRMNGEWFRVDGEFYHRFYSDLSNYMAPIIKVNYVHGRELESKIFKVTNGIIANKEFIRS